MINSTVLKGLFFTVAASIACAETAFQIPLYFEQHQAMDGTHGYLARKAGISFCLAPDQITLSFKNEEQQDQHIFFSLLNALPSSMESLEMQECKVHYFIGNDPSQWKTNIPTYKKVAYRGVYPGIDMILYGTGNCLEYDFEIAPHANPSDICLRIEGADALSLDADGVLHISQNQTEAVVIGKPFIYQWIDGEKEQIDGEFSLISETDLKFHLTASYNEDYPLVIDPILSLAFSTYLGGSATGDAGFALTVDSSGSAYVVGETFSAAFPTQNPYQSLYGGAGDAFVTKFSPSGTSLIYSTYLGGSGEDRGYDVAVDSSGSAYVTGLTASTNFPVLNAFQSMLAGTQNAFVTKFAPDGASLVYSTYLGGSNIDFGNSIAVDSSGSAYVIGNASSANFPVLNAFQSMLAGTQNAFVTKFAPNGTTLVYSTYLGGSSTDGGQAISVDSSHFAFVTGWTQSTNFPTQNPYQGTLVGAQNAFVAKFASNGTSLIYSTYFGGNGTDFGYDIALDSSGSAYITGQTTSTNLPTQNPYQGSLPGTQSAFVTKFSSNGASLVYSTYLGGSASDSANDIVVDSSGSAYVTGVVTSTNFPTLDPYQSMLTGAQNAFVTKFSPTGSSLVFSTYLGGSGTDAGLGVGIYSTNQVFVGGQTSSTNFPTRNPFQAALSGNASAFLTKFNVTSIVNPVQNLNGSWTSNRFLSQKEWMSVLTWNYPSTGVPDSYLIFQDSSLTQLIQTLPGTALTVTFHNQDSHLSYTYYVVSVSGGEQSTAAVITIPARN